VAIVNTFNGHKKLEIIGVAQGRNMLKNSKHFVYIIINEEQKPKLATLRHAGMAVNHVRQEIIKPDALSAASQIIPKLGKHHPEKLLIKSKHNKPWFTRSESV
jgi:hypothetical protein